MKRILYLSQIIIVIIICATSMIAASAGMANAATRTVSWTGVTTYTDNSPIETANLPVKYDVWYVDGTTGTRTTVVTGTTATSATFDDATLVKGRAYTFYGKAITQDGSGSADSAGYSWSRPFQVPKAPGGFTVQ